jgi:hypothetical protein
LNTVITAPLDDQRGHDIVHLTAASPPQHLDAMTLYFIAPLLLYPHLDIMAWHYERALSHHDALLTTAVACSTTNERRCHYVISITGRASSEQPRSCSPAVTLSGLTDRPGQPHHLVLFVP